MEGFQLLSGSGAVDEAPRVEAQLARLLGTPHAAGLFGKRPADPRGREPPARIVSIVGPQASGKSTLCNLLFGTSFEQQDAAQRFGTRTTRGVWMARAPSMPRVLIMDAQGTDSIDAGDASRLFERRASLLTLALSHVVILNMWYTDIGRADASNLGLLKQIFAAHHEMHTGAITRTVLLVAVRDYPSGRSTAPSVDQLQHQLRQHLTAAHSDAIAPLYPSAGSAPAIEDTFDLRVAVLPNFVFQPTEFGAAVAELRDRHFASLPASSSLDLKALPVRVRNLWEQICLHRGARCVGI